MYILISLENVYNQNDPATVKLISPLINIILKSYPRISF